MPTGSASSNLMWCKSCKALIANWKNPCAGCGYQHTSFSEVTTTFNPTEELKTNMAAENQQRDAARATAIGKLSAKLKVMESRGVNGIYVPGKFAKMFSESRYDYGYSFVDGDLMLINHTHPSSGSNFTVSGQQNFIGVARISGRDATNIGFTKTLFGESGSVNLKTLKRT